MWYGTETGTIYSFGVINPFIEGVSPEKIKHVGLFYDGLPMPMLATAAKLTPTLKKAFKQISEYRSSNVEDFERRFESREAQFEKLITSVEPVEDTEKIEVPTLEMKRNDIGGILSCGSISILGAYLAYQSFSEGNDNFMFWGIFSSMSALATVAWARRYRINRL